MTVVLDVPIRAHVPGVSEDDLFRSYARPVIRIEPCACGTDVEQFTGEDTEAVVVRHNASLRHAAWSAQSRLVP